VRGRLAAGDPAAAVAVDEVWVLERTLRDVGGARWRLAGRLGAGGAPAASAGGATRAVAA
jgi:hypothetical protein